MTTWTWLGDHLALDFANTVRESEGSMVDLIPTADGVAGWLAAEGDRLPPVGALDADAVAALRELRDAVVTLLRAAEAGRNLPQAAVRVVNEAVEGTATTRLLVGVGRTRVAAATADPVSMLRGVLGAAAVDLLARDDLANLALCRAPGCGQFFHRARPIQRWCSPGCGNRARVDRHRHRRVRPEGDAG